MFYIVLLFYGFLTIFDILFLCVRTTLSASALRGAVLMFKNSLHSVFYRTFRTLYIINRILRKNIIQINDLRSSYNVRIFPPNVLKIKKNRTLHNLLLTLHPKTPPKRIPYSTPIVLLFFAPFQNNQNNANHTQQNNKIHQSVCTNTLPIIKDNHLTK